LLHSTIEKNPVVAHNETLYRPHIDGLPAIAVTLVLIYHTFPRRLPGGFIGVDIIFVISGHLITKIIFGELGRHDYSLTRLVPSTAYSAYSASSAAPVSMTGSAQLTALRQHFVSAIELLDNAESITCYGNGGGPRAILSGLALSGTY
jgi:peptidoglycan/LPS O-acetylase OafA/YrhL